MCSGCNKVYNVIDMKNGLCEKCYSEKGATSFDFSHNSNNAISQSTLEDKILNMAAYSFYIYGIISGLVALVFLGLMIKEIFNG